MSRDLFLPDLFGVLDDVLGDAMHHGVRDALLHAAHGEAGMMGVYDEVPLELRNRIEDVVKSRLFLLLFCYYII